MSKKNVDTGLGLERTLAILNGYDSLYETSVLKPILEEIMSKSQQDLEKEKKSFRILTDHLRASVFILGDVNPTIPSNHGRGYVLRRIIRRSFRFCKKLEINVEDWINTSNIVIDMYKEYYPELEKNRSFIIKEMEKENERFSKALAKGLFYLKRMMPEIKKKGKINGETAFLLCISFSPNFLFLCRLVRY